MERDYIDSVEGLINTTILEQGSSGSILSALNERKVDLETSERATVQRYIDAMRPVYAAMIVDDFSGNTAGLYDGSAIYVDRNVMMVGRSLETTIAQAGEVHAHETYHQTNHHLAPMQVVADARAGVYALIGGIAFTETELVEGLTVAETGNAFVSHDYRRYEDMVRQAAATSGQGIDGIATAVNKKKDLTLVDDRAQVPLTEMAV